MKKIAVLCFILTYNLAYCLRIDRVILSTDINPLYHEFIPLVTRAWRQIVGVIPTVAIIATVQEANRIAESCAQIIRFDPIPEIPTSLYAQVVRLLLPALFADDGCIVSDIDMLPLSKNYFIDSVAGIPADHFIIYRDCAYISGANRYPMCYIVGKGSTFKDIFHIVSVAQIPEIVKRWYSLGLGWHTDELLLYWYINHWHEKNRITKLGHAVKPRIDRSNWVYDEKLINTDYYIDAHMPRPLHQHQYAINLLAKSIGISNENMIEEST